jgi:hypothetical protein
MGGVFLAEQVVVGKQHRAVWKFSQGRREQSRCSNIDEVAKNLMQRASSG